MADHTTTRLKLPYPDPNGKVTVGATDFQELAQKLDEVAVETLQDTKAKRPAAGVLSRLFRATDTGVIYYDTGTEWQAREWPGRLVHSATSSALDGFLLCEGQEVSRSAYPFLLLAIGTTYGAGDGSTTFNVPDFRERVPVGKGGGLTTLGTKGGESTHTLTVAELAVHKHKPESPSSSFVSQGGGGSPRITYEGGGTLQNAEKTNETATAGSNAPHNNMQPYTVCTVWVKT
jgi:microcystin-dependent protein